MKKTLQVSARLLCAATIVLSSTRPAIAAEVYVPLTRPAGSQQGLAVNLEPQAQLDNLGTVPRGYSVRFIPAGSDGTQPGQLLGSGRLEPARSAAVFYAGNSPGLIAVSGAPQIAVVGNVFVGWFTGPGAQAQLPAVKSDGGSLAGQAVLLSRLTWSRDGSAVADLGVVNLSRAVAHCTAELNDTLGTFKAPVNFTIAPLSLAAFPDVIGTRVQGTPPEANTIFPRVRCDAQFFAFGVNFFTDAAGNHQTVVAWPSTQVGS
jgi:hypothetical protein